MNPIYQFDHPYTDVISNINLCKPETQEVRDYLAKQVSTNMGRDIVEKLKAMSEESKQKTKEERVIDIIHGGMERHFGMTIQEFQEIYEELLRSNPEKLV